MRIRIIYKLILLCSLSACDPALRLITSASADAGEPGDAALSDKGAVPGLVHRWSSQFGDSASDHGRAIAVDDNGNVTLAGRFEQTADFGDGPLESAGSTDIFVASYDPSGAHRWSDRFGDTSNDGGWGVSVDGGGNVILTGEFRGTVDFGGGPRESAGGTDIFVASYSPSGSHRWSKRFGGRLDDRGLGVAVDGNGNLALTGFFYESADFGGGSVMSAGGSDIFVASYDPGGKHQWSKRFGSAFNDVGHGVAFDGGGNVTVTGFFAGTVDFGGGLLTSAGGSDIFVASYGPSGEHRWSKRFGGASSDRGSSVAADGDGNTTLVGRFHEDADFGGGPLKNVGASDIFVASYAPSGAHRWSRRFGGFRIDSGEGVAVDDSGNIALIGDFAGTVDFGGGSLTSAGEADIFVLQLGPQP